MRTLHYFLPSLRSWRYCVGARLKFWRRSRVPKKGSKDKAVEILAARPSNLTRLYYNGSAGRQISLEYFTIPPATQAIFCRYPGTGSCTSVDCPKESLINFYCFAFFQTLCSTDFPYFNLLSLSLTFLKVFLKPFGYLQLFLV